MEELSAEALAILVAAHRPQDEREHRSRGVMLEALGNLPRPWDRHADPVHVTASGVVVGHRGTVLHRHRRLRRWLQPGGHLEAGEWPAAGALRESHEETGLAVSHPDDGPVLVHLDVHPASEGHTHLDLRYLLWAGPDDPTPPPEESQEVRWFSWAQAAAVADDALQGALVAAQGHQHLSPSGGGEGRW